jgi:hypothetical protein
LTSVNEQLLEEKICFFLRLMKQIRLHGWQLDYQPVNSPFDDDHSETLMGLVFPLRFVHPIDIKVLSFSDTLKLVCGTEAEASIWDVSSGLDRMVKTLVRSEPMASTNYRTRDFFSRTLQALRPPDHENILKRMVAVARSELAGDALGDELWYRCQEQGISLTPCQEQVLYTLSVNGFEHCAQSIRDGVMLQDTSWQKLGMRRREFECLVNKLRRKSEKAECYDESREWCGWLHWAVNEVKKLGRSGLFES